MTSASVGPISHSLSQLVNQYASVVSLYSHIGKYIPRGDVPF